MPQKSPSPRHVLTPDALAMLRRIAGAGKALQWWLGRLDNPMSLRALLERSPS